VASRPDCDRRAEIHTVAAETGLSGNWSPNGTTIAYAREVDGVLQIFTRGVGAAKARRLPSVLDCDHPFWSPDDTIFYLSPRNTKLAQSDRRNRWHAHPRGENAKLPLSVS
jgi:Tol biopolymer transport system component